MKGKSAGSSVVRLGRLLGLTAALALPVAASPAPIAALWRKLRRSMIISMLVRKL
jgi:hypothetical protein